MPRHVGTALDVVEILRLHLLLVCLSVVEVVEVGNNDWDWQGDRQHTGNGTQGPHYFSPHTYWPVSIRSEHGREEDRERGVSGCRYQQNEKGGGTAQAVFRWAVPAASRFPFSFL